MYIHTQSNHPPSIIKNLPAAISRRISDISCDEETFKKATPIDDDALKSSGYTESLSYTNDQPRRKRMNRQRNIIWFNPPFSKNVSTNIGCTFLKLVDKHFPKKSKLNRIFNRNTLKVSYSCMKNVARNHQSPQQANSGKRQENYQQNLQLQKQEPLPPPREVLDDQRHLQS